MCFCLSLLRPRRDLPIWESQEFSSNHAETSLESSDFFAEIPSGRHLKGFQQKVLMARRKPTPSLGEFEVAKPKSMAEYVVVYHML